MKINTWLKHLIYLLLIVALSWMGITILSNYYAEVQRSYNINIILIMLVNFIFFGGIGAVLGLDNFILQFKMEGQWRFNLPKLIVLGLPSLILSIPHLLFILLPSAMQFMDTICLIPNIVFGYILVSSIVREPISE